MSTKKECCARQRTLRFAKDQLAPKMTPEQAVRIIERAYMSHMDRRMADYYDYEPSFDDMYPDRPCDYDGMCEQAEYYNELMYYD